MGSRGAVRLGTLMALVLILAGSVGQASSTARAMTPTGNLHAADLAVADPIAPIMTTGTASDPAVRRAAEANEVASPILENPPVDDVSLAFDRLARNGEWLGFHMPATGGPEAKPGPFDHHMQGFARSPQLGREPIVYVTYSGYEDDDEDFGAILVVRLASRPQDGERLRSNRLERDMKTTYTEAPETDKVVKVIVPDDTGHPSGMQMVGDVLAVPQHKRIVFYDCTDPENPDPTPFAPLEFTHGSWAVAITRLESGKYFVAIPDGDGVYFYKSNTDSFFDPDVDIEFTFHSSIDKATLKATGYWPFRTDCSDSEHFLHNCDGGESFQSLSFVNEVGGRLYLIGSANSDTWSPVWGWGGDNNLFLLEVTGFDGTQAQVTGVAKKKTHLNSPGGLETGCGNCYTFPEDGKDKKITRRTEANYNAGATAYVTPSGVLMYYGVSHWADGPGGIVKFAEVRSKVVTADGTCGQPRFRVNHLGGPHTVPEVSSLVLNGTTGVDEPWVDMYQHSSFDGWNVMMDYATRFDDDYDDFGKLDGSFGECRGFPILHSDKRDGFCGCMTSFMWCGPEGSALYFYDNTDYEPGGQTYDWSSTDDVTNGVPGLGYAIGVSSVGSSFNDQASSVWIDWSPDSVGYAWSAEGNGAIDPIGSGATARFYAACGTGTATVTLDVEGETTSTEVHVTNVPPVVDAIAVDPVPVPEGEAVGLTVDWTDPCAAINHLTVDWGDPTARSGGPGTWDLIDADTRREVSYGSYGDNGTYTVRACARDEEAADCATVDATVTNVAPSVSAHAATSTTHAGEPATMTGQFADPGWNDTVTISASVGSVTQDEGAEGAWTWSYTPGGDPAENQTVTVTATDDDGGWSTTTFDLGVTPAADVAVTGGATPRHVRAGEVFTYAFTARNHGPNASTVSFSDTLPDDVTFESLTPPAGWACGHVSGVVTCDPAPMVAGASATLYVKARVRDGIPPNTVTHCVATVTGTTADLYPTNDTATVVVDVYVTRRSSPGDCNVDLRVNAGDLSALVLEIFDQGAFGATGCDANEDGVVNAGDISRTVLLIFGH